MSYLFFVRISMYESSSHGNEGLGLSSPDYNLLTDSFSKEDGVR